MKKKFSVHAAREVEQIGKDFVVTAWEDMGEVELDEELNDTESAFDAVKDNGWFEDGVESEDIEMAADDDHNLYIDEAGTGMPVLELRVIVEAKKRVKADKHNNTPDIWAIALDETEYWGENFMAEFPEIEKIYSIFAVDANLQVHIASMTPSIEIWYVMPYVVYKDYGSISQERLDQIDEEVRNENNIAHEMVDYINYSTFKNLPAKFKLHIDKGEPIETENDEEYAEAEREQMEDAVEYLNGNWPSFDFDKVSAKKVEAKSVLKVAAELLKDKSEDDKTNTEGDMKGTLKDIKAKANGENTENKVIAAKYSDEEWKFAEAMRKKTGTKVTTEDGKIKVSYHNTVIGEYDPKTGSVKIFNGGYYTKTTKDRINEMLALAGFKGRVFQKDGVWYIENGGKKPEEFKEGMSVSASLDVKAAAGPLTILNEMKAGLAKLADAKTKERFLSTNKHGVFSAPGFDYIMGGKASDTIVDAWSDYANGKIKDEEVIEKVEANIDAAIAEISKKYGDKTVEQIKNRTEAKLKVKADELPATDRYGTPEIGGAPANDADEVIADGVEPKPAEAKEGEPKPEEKKTEVSTEGGDVNVEIPGEKGMSAIVTIQKALREATNQKAISTEVIQQLNKILKEAGLTATGKVQAMKINAVAKDKAVKTIQAAELFYNTKIANFEVSDLCGEKTKKRAKELKAIIASKLEQATDGFLPVIEGKSGDERMAVTSSLDVIAGAMKEWQAFEESHGEYAESMLKVEATMNCLQELGDNNAITASEVGLKFKDYFDMTDKERRTIKAHVISRAQEVSGLSVAKIPLSMTSEETVAAIREKRLTAAKTELGEAMIRVERAEGKIPQEKVLEV